jgi:hypothetical protein
MSSFIQFSKYLFILFIGFCIGSYASYELIQAVIQHAIDKGKIKFEIVKDKK